MTSLPHLLLQTREQLLAIAAERGLGLRPHLEQDELVADIVNDMLEKDEMVTTDGVLSVLPEGFGFVRMLSRDFASTAVDVYVSSNQVHKLNLQVGHRIRGPIRAPRGTERTFALVHVDLVEDNAPEDLLKVATFLSRTVTVSDRPMSICEPKQLRGGKAIGSAQLDLFAMQSLAPMCFGHRTLLHAPAAWPSARFLALLANALQQQHEQLDVTVCLLDQRPEDIAAARLQLAAPSNTLVNHTLVSTAFAAPPERHVVVAELALHRCMRAVEQGRDVVLLIDSLTALTRAQSRSSAPSGAWIQPGLDAKSVLPAKQLLASAQQCAEGGSLTVIATVTTGAPGTIDAAIEHEFVALTNSDVVIANDVPIDGDALLPFDVARTRTRTEDDPTSKAQREVIAALRLELAALPPPQRAARWRTFCSG